MLLCISLSDVVLLENIKEMVLHYVVKWDQSKKCPRSASMHPAGCRPNGHSQIHNQLQQAHRLKQLTARPRARLVQPSAKPRRAPGPGGPLFQLVQVLWKPLASPAQVLDVQSLTTSEPNLFIHLESYLWVGWTGFNILLMYKWIELFLVLLFFNI